MLLRRFGTSLQSVTPDFDSRAITEISFRREGGTSIPAEEFEAEYEKVGEEELAGTTDGPVQSEAETALLDHLQAAITERLEELDEDQVLVLENQTGVDYPKLRDRKEPVIIDGENRLHFHWRVDPPLRLGTFRRRSS